MSEEKPASGRMGRSHTTTGATHTPEAATASVPVSSRFQFRAVSFSNRTRYCFQSTALVWLP